MNRIAQAIIGSLLAAGCSMQGAPDKTSLQPMSLKGGASHVRLCDERVAFEVKPSSGTRPEDRSYYGVWKGEVPLGGSTGTMCVGLVVQDIQQGKANNWWVWNLGTGQDMTNFQGMGVANWWGRMDGDRMFLDSDQPYLGNVYSYEFSPPNAKGELHGKFKVESTDRTRKAAYPFVMYRNPSPALAAAPNIASK